VSTSVDQEGSEDSGKTSAWSRRIDLFAALAFALGAIPGVAVIGNYGFADDYGQMALTNHQAVGWMKSMVGCGRPLQILALGVWKLFPAISDLWVYHAIAAVAGGVLAWVLYRFMRALGRSAPSAVLLGFGTVAFVPGLLIQIAWLQMFPFLIATIGSVIAAKMLLENKRRPWIAGVIVGCAWLCYQPSALVGVVLIAATPLLAAEDSVVESWRALWWKRLAESLAPVAGAGLISIVMVKLAVAQHWAKAGGRHQFLGNLGHHLHVWFRAQLPMAFRLWSPFGLSHRVFVIELVLGIVCLVNALRRRRVLDVVVAILAMAIASYLLAFATAEIDVDSRALVASQVAVAILMLCGLSQLVEWATKRWRGVTTGTLVLLSLVLCVHATIVLSHDWKRPNYRELTLVSQVLSPQKCEHLRYIVLAPPQTTTLGPAEANEFGSPTSKAPWMAQKMVQLVCASKGVTNVPLPHVVSTNAEPSTTLDFATILNH
jgi:nitrate reductase NapE component